MTLLLVTVAEQVGIITQDTLLCRDEGERPDGWRGTRPMEADEPVRSWGDGTADEVPCIGIVNKLGLFPAMKMIGGMNGELLPAATWFTALSSGLGFADIDEAHEHAPSMLDSLMRMGSRAGELAVVHVGWSPSAGRVVGWAYTWNGDGIDVARVLDNHVISPAPDTSTAAYARAFDLAEPAARGASVDFHGRMAAVIFNDLQRGFFRRGAAIGGQLVQARVDESGITTRVMRDFPDLKQRRAEAKTARAEIVGQIAQAGSVGPARSTSS